MKNKKAAMRNWTPTNPAFDPNEPMQVGGQAVIEGVMMRAKGMIATAVRNPDGEIVVKKEEYRSLIERHPSLNIPVLRGAIGLVEMMIIGIKTLNYSAEVALGNDGVASKEKGDEEGGMMTLPLMAAFLAALALGVAVFFFLPLFVVTRVFSIEQDPVLFNLVAGAIRVAILIAYLYSISLAKDIHRLFQYHGAEHKAVFTFEQNAPLEVASAMTYTRFHPRCGTSFVLLVMFVSIVLFALLDTAVLSVHGSLSLTLRLCTHIPLIPVVGGISYEVLKYSARHVATPIGKIIVAPGLWLQTITTKEPDESQMEVSLAAIKAALRIDAEPVGVRREEAAVRV